MWNFQASVTSKIEVLRRNREDTDTLRYRLRSLNGMAAEVADPAPIRESSPR